LAIPLGRTQLFGICGISSSVIMRLVNAETRKLEEFFGTDIPIYATLSHTWG